MRDDAKTGVTAATARRDATAREGCACGEDPTAADDAPSA